MTAHATVNQAEAPAVPPVAWLPVEEFIDRYPPAFYAACWTEIDHAGAEVYDNPDDPDGEYDARFIAGGDSGMPFDDLVKSVADEGVSEPVDIDDGKVVDGHHRVVAAMLTGQPVPFLLWSTSEPVVGGTASNG